MQVVGKMRNAESKMRSDAASNHVTAVIPHITAMTSRQSERDNYISRAHARCARTVGYCQQFVIDRAHAESPGAFK